MKTYNGALLWLILTLAVLFPLIGNGQSEVVPAPEVAVEAPAPVPAPAMEPAVATAEPIIVATEPTPAQEVDSIFKDITSLVQNWKSLGLLGAISALILLLTKIMKTKLMGEFFTKRHPLVQRAIVVTLGVISGVVVAMTTGVGWVPAIVTGLVGSGGAISIYEVFKPLFKKA